MFPNEVAWGEEKSEGEEEEERWGKGTTTERLTFCERTRIHVFASEITLARITTRADTSTRVL